MFISRIKAACILASGPFPDAGLAATRHSVWYEGSRSSIMQEQSLLWALSNQIGVGMTTIVCLELFVYILGA